MRAISVEINALLRQMPESAARAFKATLVRDRFAEAVAKEYGKQTAAFILSHVQAVYVQKDDAPYAGPEPERRDVILRVYSDDSLVRSDLDARQESLKLKLLPLGIRFDKLKVHQSRFDMRKRAPYADLLREWAEAGEVALGGVDAGAGPVQSGEAEYDAALHMTPEEVERVAAQVDDPAVRRAIARAISAQTV